VLVSIVLAVTNSMVPWFAFAVYGGLGLIAILLERGRYLPTISGANFEPTDERFADPVTGQMIRVYVDAITGQRDYRSDT
jgi:hypothetical protein